MEVSRDYGARRWLAREGKAPWLGSDVPTRLDLLGVVGTLAYAALDDMDYVTGARLPESTSIA